MEKDRSAVVSERMEGGEGTTRAEWQEDDEPVDSGSAAVEPAPGSNRAREMAKAMEVVERESQAIADSFSSLFSSLRSALSEVTGSSVDHMECFGDAAGRLQESVLDAAAKGNRFINSCLRMNEEMKGIDNLAIQIKMLRRNVDALDVAVNKLLRFP